MGALNLSSRRLHPTSRSYRVFLPYFILLLGFCFTGLVYHYFSKLTYEQDRIRFDRSVQEVQDQIKLRIATSITLLRAATGLFAASDRVNAGEFERFVHQIELDKNYKGVQGIGYARRYRADETTNVIATMQREGVTDFKVWPADSSGDEHTVILYLQPATPANKRAVGFNMSTEAARRQAMEIARDTGAPTASGRVKLVQEDELPDTQAGFLIYVPIYRKNMTLATATDRSKALLGFV